MKGEQENIHLQFDLSQQNQLVTMDAKTGKIKEGNPVPGKPMKFIMTRPGESIPFDRLSEISDAYSMGLI